MTTFYKVTTNHTDGSTAVMSGLTINDVVCIVGTLENLTFSLCTIIPEDDEQ